MALDIGTVLGSIWGFLQKFGNEWDTAGRIIVIIVVTVVLRWILLIVVRRVVGGIVSGVKAKQEVTATTQLLVSPLAQARVIQRTRTVGAVLTNIITWTLAAIAIISILSALSFDVGALVASAGIAGVALGFGAQNIVKDFLNGIFLVFEDQLGVGDIVDLDTVSGTVESVGLRVTQIRAVDGTLWYVRNGEITMVGNMSQGWARAIIDVLVPAGTDVDAVEQLMTTACTEMMKEKAWSRRISGRPEMWGIDALKGDTLVVKLAVKTRPAQQWDVSRELRARIIKLFDQYHIHLSPDRAIIVMPSRSGHERTGKGVEDAAAAENSGKKVARPAKKTAKEG